jgi:hypothetical protein
MTEKGSHSGNSPTENFGDKFLAGIHPCFLKMIKILAATDQERITSALLSAAKVW